MTEYFWKNKNVLITGFEGFLGSNLTKRLISSGANVIGLDILVGRKNTLLKKNDFKDFVAIKGDVADFKLVKKILSKYKINIVFHLAAEAIVLRSHKYPLRTFSSNIEGTWSVLEACREQKRVKAVIIASSDKAYGDQKILPYTEETPLQGRHPYDVSKSCADLLAYTYAYTYKLPVAITRCGNIFGPGDFNFSRIAPDTIRSALHNKPLIIRSDGKFTRDYVFVEDVIDGYLLLAEKLEKHRLRGHAFNFSYEKPLSVLAFVKKIQKHANKKNLYRILNEAKYEIKDQYLSSKKARRVLRWRPSYSLERGLKATVDWYRSHFNK